MKNNFIFKYGTMFCFSMLSIFSLQHAKAKTDKVQSIVDHSLLTVEDVFANIPTSSRVYTRLKNARAVMICPNITHISLVFGGSGGDCVLLSRDARNSWSSPAFYKMSSGSFGIQLGVQNTEVMLFIMNERSLRKLLDSQFTMGASASATAAKSSSDANKDTADIYNLQKASGLFVGASLKGSKLKINSSANHKYYNQIVGPEDIVMAMRVNNPAANHLRKILIKYSNMAKNVQPEKKSSKNHNVEDDNGDTNTNDDSGAIDLAPQKGSSSHNIKSENLPSPSKSRK
ncbi:MULTISPECIES: lipid-binding SYLF domain-containing protein [Commensalibacter]|uniref:lipid-binding SYLF domain-containing protein n=1 Tax=Commensalibacter TaxID=1079922 RepID=UPI001E28DEE1|nr:MULTISPECIES: lipid-binding SYLF domain-containing protein [Commensalibacter]